MPGRAIISDRRTGSLGLGGRDGVLLNILSVADFIIKINRWFIRCPVSQVRAETSVSKAINQLSFIAEKLFGN